MMIIQEKPSIEENDSSRQSIYIIRTGKISLVVAINLPYIFNIFFIFMI